MKELRFEWDSAKDAANQRKHGVAFAEASTVFYDEEALLLSDPDHSEDEDRFVLLVSMSTLSEGLSFKLLEGRAHRTAPLRLRRCGPAPTA
jgi:uncharacterized DUF497 family protein